MINFPVMFRRISAWVLRTPSDLYAWRSVAWSGTVFCAVSSIFNGVMTSPDGKNWTTREGAISGRAIVWAQELGLFVAVGGFDGVATSPDGITWTQRSGFGINPRAVAWSGTVLVAVGNGDGLASNVMTSTDGVTWTLRTSVQADDLLAVAWSGATFIVAGLFGAVQTSSDGVTWGGALTLTGNGNVRALSRLGGTVVAVGDGGTVHTTTNNGTSWTQRTAASNNNWYGLANNGSLFASVSISGTGDRVMTSADNGITWLRGNSAADAPWEGLAYGGGQFVAVGSGGSDGAVMTSSDGFGE